MAGVHCARCESNVRLEQDGRSCSNCGAQLVTPIPGDKQRPAHDNTATTPTRTATPKK